MAIEMIEWARRQKTGSQTAKAVLAYLAVRSDANGWSWPSINTIARDCEMGRRTVIRALDLLVRLNLVDRERPSYNTPTRHTSNYYRLDFRPKLVSDRSAEYRKSGGLSGTPPSARAAPGVVSL